MLTLRFWFCLALDPLVPTRRFLLLHAFNPPRAERKRSRGVTAGAETLVGGPVEQALTLRKIFNDLCYDRHPDPYDDLLNPNFLNQRGHLRLLFIGTPHLQNVRFGKLTAYTTATANYSYNFCLL